MKIDNREISKGDQLVYSQVTGVGKTTRKNCEVIDIMEHTQAVKVRFLTSGVRLMTSWVHESRLSWPVVSQ